MKKLTSVIMIVAAVVMSASIASAGLTIPDPGYGRGMYLQAATVPQQVTWQGDTVWEYVYDLYVGEYHDTYNSIYNAFLKFDTGDAGSLVGLYNGKVVQQWSSYAAGEIPAPYWWWSAPDSVPTPQYIDVDDLDADGITNEWSYAVGPSQTAQQWTYDSALSTWADANGVSNIWHAPSDYGDGAGGDNDGGDFQYGVIFDDAATNPFGDTSWTPVDGVFFGGNDEMDCRSDDPILNFTVRLLSTQGPHGTVTLYYDEYYMNYTFGGTVVGPGPLPPGDVDEDGDIDADDIDLMGQYILTGIAPTTGNYDLSDDGVTGGTNGAIDINDLDYLVRHLVETSAVDGDGNPIFGTQYGDFNLDGEIELGDLTRLGTYYGVGDTWSQGNANPHLDTDIELGDLTILGTYYGASNGGVDAIPEPASASLLLLGAVAALRRRRKA